MLQIALKGPKRGPTARRPQWAYLWPGGHLAAGSPAIPWAKACPESNLRAKISKSPDYI